MKWILRSYLLRAFLCSRSVLHLWHWVEKSMDLSYWSLVCFVTVWILKSRTTAGWRSPVCVRVRALNQRGVDSKWTDVFETVICLDKVMKHEILNAFHFASVISKPVCALCWKWDIIRREKHGEGKPCLRASLWGGYQVFWGYLIFEVVGFLQSECAQCAEEFLYSEHLKHDVFFVKSVM